MRPILLVGPPLLTLGGLVVAVSFLTHQPRAVRIVAALVGLALVAGGALFTMLGMHWTLRDDTYVALRTDGVAVQAAGQEVVIAWDELERTDWNPARRELVLVRKVGANVVLARPYARIDGAALAARITAIQRKSR